MDGVGWAHDTKYKYFYQTTTSFATHPDFLSTIRPFSYSIDNLKGETMTTT